MTTAVLKVENVHKRFRRLEVLRGASLGIEPGELVGIVGENGSGKTTLLRIIVGLLRRDRGTITMNGGYGYCPQEPLVFDGLTMEENIAYFNAAYGLSRREGLARGERLMERLNCRQHGGRPAGVLSGGTRQKLNLILSLLHSPDLLILDEPYQGFDYDSYLAFWDLARELKGQRKSMLMVSHLVHERSWLDRIYTLRDGRAHDGD